MKDDNKDAFEIFEEKGDGVPSSELSERKHEGFRKFLIGVFQAIQCLDFPGTKELLRMKSLAKCDGVIKAMAVDLTEDPSNISHWLLALEKTYKRNKRRLEGRKKPRKKKDD